MSQTTAPNSRRALTFALCLLGLILAMLFSQRILVGKAAASSRPDPVTWRLKVDAKLPVVCTVLDPDCKPA